MAGFDGKWRCWNIMAVIKHEFESNKGPVSLERRAMIMLKTSIKLLYHKSCKLIEINIMKLNLQSHV
jgi:hypothetical protein